jgi:bifunctional non-homologous end joining protein LigD
MLWDEHGHKKIRPMLTFLIRQPFDDPNYIMEIKFDGTRSITYIDVENKSVEFLNRRNIWFQDRYPELKELWKDVKAKERIILDGEIVVFVRGKPDFSKLASREHVGSKLRAKMLSEKHPATFVVFDILHLDGKDLVDLPLIERKQILDETVKESDRLLKSVFVNEKGKQFFKQMKEKGLEGMVAKKINSRYVQQRSKDWLKLKTLNTLDVVIVGYTSGIGKREEVFGSILAGIYHEGRLHYLGRVGTGWSDDFLKETLPRLEKLKTKKSPIQPEPRISMPDNRKIIWVKPQLVAEIQYLLLTRDLQMRAPAFKRLREDKLPEECVIDVLESPYE